MFSTSSRYTHTSTVTLKMEKRKGKEEENNRNQNSENLVSRVVLEGTSRVPYKFEQVQYSLTTRYCVDVWGEMVVIRKSEA